jgi:hypothetical protein
MKAKDKVSGVVDVAKPYVERIAHDDELHEHVKKAYDSAAKIYDELIGGRDRKGLALKVARDKELQDELRHAVEELRRAGQRVKGKDAHKGRNATLLLTGIALGVLFNPATGPDTRRWLREQILGEEEPFEYSTNEA